MRKASLIIAGLLLMPALLAYADGGKTEPLAIVVKKGSKLADISLADLTKVFKGQQKAASDGTKFALTMRSNGSPERTAFLEQVLQMTEQEYQKYFLQAVFTGQCKAAPKNVSGVDSLKAAMESNEGTIGYVKLSEIDDSMAVVTVDGKKPGDAGYSLTAK